MTIERVPASHRIARLLQEKIERQEYRQGEWLPTERELASEFGADRGTVRAALSHLAEMRLIERQPGRRPWVTVRSGEAVVQDGLATSAATVQTIAAIIPQPPNYPALSLIQRGILRVLRKSDPPYRLIVFDNQGDVWSQSVALERHALEAIECDGIAGAILWQIGRQETLPEIARLQQKGVPLVLLDRFPEGVVCDFVGVDNRAAAGDAVRYLLQLGHRRIAHLTSVEALSTGQERVEGYEEALRSWGIEPSADLIYRLPYRDDLSPDMRPAVDHFLSLSEPPTAVFAMNDVLAHTFITEVESRGLRVPDDFSVIGFDDHDRHSLQPAILTTMHQPFERMGQRAAELLLQRLASPRISNVPYQHVLLPVPLVARSSCRAL